MSRRTRGEGGMTLIETMSAVVMFSMVTVGLVPVVATSLRSASLARSYTMAENLAVDAIEGIRSLPLFVSYSVRSRKMDVLDLYFPCTDPVTQAGCTNGSVAYIDTDEQPHTFRTTCATDVVDSVGCPSDLPEGFILSIDAQFVRPSRTAPEQYEVVAVPPGYAWNSPGSDAPPEGLVRITVAVTWQLGGSTKDFTIATLVGENEVRRRQVSATASVDHAVQVLTSFVAPDTGARSQLLALAGTSRSRLSSSLLAETEQGAGGGTISLVRLTSGAETAEDIASESGAASFLKAPPDSMTPGQSVMSRVLQHPDLSGAPAVAFLGPSLTEGVSRPELVASVSAGALVAEGASAVSEGGGMDDQPPVFNLWINNQADTSAESRLHLDVTSERPLFSARQVVSDGTSASTTTTSTGSGEARGVEAVAQAAVAEARLLPVSFIPAEQESRSLVRLQTFSSRTRCLWDGSAGSTERSYAATVSVWVEQEWAAAHLNDPNSVKGFQGDASTGGRFITFPLDTSTETGRVAIASFGSDYGQDTDPLTNVRNPMVYEEPDPSNGLNGHEEDVYLFGPTPKPDGTGTYPGVHHAHTSEDGGTVVHDHPYFLTSWSASGSASGEPTVSSGSALAGMDPAALQFNTGPTHPDIPESGLNVSIGRLWCEAQEPR